MTQIVLEIRRNGRTGAMYMSLREPRSDVGGISSFGYDCADREPAGFAAGTLGADEVGTYLITKLSEYEAVTDALRAALRAPAGTQEPLLVWAAPQVEDVPWETLFAEGSFLALDPRWPIGRMSTQDTQAEPREFRSPLRVMAVLAAAGIDAEPQWVELRDALGSIPFDVTVRVLAAQDTVLAAVQVGNPDNLTVTAERVQPDPMALPAQITGFRPNILHFFCHGGVEAGSSFLEIATRGTVSSDRGAVSFELKDFPVVNPADDLWLVVLNACKGALPPSGTSSLVSSLAARGVPAVAGMREAVTETDAHAFCRGFYRAVADMLAPLEQTEDLVPVTWCAALYHARRAICERHRGNLPCTAVAAQFREWTLPVMYVGAAPFELYRAHREKTVRHYGPPGSAQPTPEQRTELESELQVLRDLVTRQLGAPPEVIIEYQRRIWELQRLLGS